AWTNAEIILYRKDLFEDAKNKADFKAKYGYDLAAPTTWKQYQDISAFFTKDGMFGTDVKGGVETEWLAHVLQAGSPMVLDANNKVVIDNAAHKEALDFYTSLVKDAPSGAAQVDWAAAQNLFNQGKTAMTRFWAHAYRQIP
ncbi:extracellular solute-binding protein, partial [Pseudomonas aeruginosa]